MIYILPMSLIKEKLGAYSEPNKKFSKEEYTGLIRELETKDTAPIEAAYEDSEISQKKGYYTKEENGYKVESYFTKDKTALEELIEINDQQSIRGMIEAKERAFFDASKNAEFYRSMRKFYLPTQNKPGRTD